MASDVTIHASPYTPLKFPPRCCYCMEPAATTVPVTVFARRLRVSRTRTTTIAYPVQVPYCAAHGEQARYLQRYDHGATIVLGSAAAVILVVIQLVVGSALRALGALVWFGATALMMALLALGAVWIYAGGRLLIQRRYPATADHIYRRSLGVNTAMRLAQRPDNGEALVLAITFTFHNDAFASAFGTLHSTDARPTPGPEG